MGKQHVRVELHHDFVEATLHKRAWVARAPYTRDPIQIVRDRGDQQAEPTTGTAGMSFPGHDLNPNNAASDLYGKIRQNTPLRVLAGPEATLYDPFTRTITNGWNTFRYGFDTTADGWVGEGATSVTRVTTPTYEGAGALQATKTMGAGFDAIRFNDNDQLPADISAGGTTLAAWVLVPLGAAGTNWQARIEVQNAAFAWQPGTDVSVPLGTWTLLTFTPPAALLASCRAIGVQVSATGVGGAQSVYIDAVKQYTPATDVLWTLAGGTLPDDYDVDGFNGTITFTDTNVLRSATVDTGSRDHLVRAIFDLSAADVTGAGVGITIRGRAAGPADYYALNVSYATDEAMSISIVKRVGGVATSLSDSVNVAFSGGSSGGNDYIGELYIEGNRIYGKVWYRYVDEPVAWMVSAVDDDLTDGTRAGVGGIRATGNTNANLQVRVHDIVIVPGTIRFAGECASFKPRRSIGEVEYGPDGVPVKGDRWVEVTANGVLRRMGQGEPPALSALWAEIQGSNPVAHWPINEGSDATSIASALSGGQPMSVSMFTFSGGTPVPVDWDSRTVVPWLEPMATPATGNVLRFLGPITMDPGTLSWSGDYVFVVDVDAAASGQIVCVWTGTGAGTAASPRTEWIFGFFDAGSGTSWELTRRVRAAGVTDTLVSSGLVTYATGQPKHARLTTTRVGGNVDWSIWLDNSLLGSGTLVGSNWSPLGLADFQSVATAGQVSVVHVAAWADTTPPFNAANAAVVGRADELAADRLYRLCLENGIPFELLGEASDTVQMGPQPVAPFGDHVAEIERTDTCRVFESRHQPGLTMRTRPQLYSQTERLVLDVDDEGVAPELEPDVDATGIINDVTVVRPDGSSARAVDDDGPVGVNTVGRYPKRFDINVDTDVSLAEHAGWRRNLYTQPATRYPQVTADLVAAPALAEDAARVDSGDVLGLDNAEPDRAREMVFGYTETIRSHTREIAYNTGPAGGYDILTLDDPTALGRLETGGSELAASFVAGTDTSMSVAVTGTALWSTAAGDVPFDIVAAGVRLTVTAVAGASSPQTFTVTAAPVNGVVKTIEAGEEIRTYGVGVLAL